MEKVSSVSFIDLFRKMKIEIQTEEKVSIELDNHKKCDTVCAVLLAFLSPGRLCPYWKGLPLSLLLSFLFPSFLSLEDLRKT